MLIFFFAYIYIKENESLNGIQNMKNTLAENMLRFGPKNLSEESRNNLRQLTEAVGLWDTELKWINSFVNDVNSAITKKETSEALKANSLPRLKAVQEMESIMYPGTTVPSPTPKWSFTFGGQTIEGKAGSYLKAEDLFQKDIDADIKTWKTIWSYMFPFINDANSPVMKALSAIRIDGRPYISITNKAVQTAINGWSAEKKSKATTSPK